MGQVTPSSPAGQLFQALRPDDHAVARGHVAEVDVGADLGDAEEDAGRLAHAVLAVHHQHLPLAPDPHAPALQRGPRRRGVRREDVEEALDEGVAFDIEIGAGDHREHRRERAGPVFVQADRQVFSELHHLAPQR
jgi:hypothetical protein